MAGFPRWLAQLWRAMTRGRALDRDLRDELESYVHLASDEAMAEGEPPREARRRAHVALGGMAQVEEAVRARRPGAWLAGVLQDARFGLRVLRRSPAFTASAALTLAVAIGATAAMASALRAIVVTPLPYPDAGSLVALTGHGYVGEYLQYRERSQAFDAAAWSVVAPRTLTGRGEPVRLGTAVATPDLFDVLAVTPALGAGWHPADSTTSAERIVTISHGLWRDRFGADPSVIGSTMPLDGEPHRIRGVMPRGFAFPDADIDVWVPATIDPADRVALWSVAGSLVARLRPGATLDAARAEVEALAPTFGAMFPWRMPPGYGEDATAEPLKAYLIGDAETMLGAALGAVGFVLLIACLNVGVLLVGRSMARRLELTTRAALGASRARLVRQSLVESAVLAAIGGLGGLAVAAFATTALRTWLPPATPRLHEVGPDVWTVAAVAILTLAAGLAIAIVPAWRAARPGVRPMHGQRHHGDDRAARITTRSLVALEMALAVTLVVGAALLGRSLVRLLDVDPGFAPAGRLSATVAPSPARYADAASRRAFFTDLVARVEAMEGVSGAAVTDRLPFDAAPWGSVFAIEGRPDPATVTGEWPWADYRAVVSPSFFATMGIELDRGRAFTAGDTAAAEAVAIASAALASEYWPGEDAVGRRIRFPGMPAGQWITIVGIVGDVRWARLDEEPQGALFLPIGQAAPGTMSLVVEAEGATDDLPAGVRAAVASLDADTPVDRMAWMSDLVGRSARSARFLAVLFAGFAAAGILLGGLGLFGVTSDAVARRAHEIAVRLAVGAEPRSIVRLVVGQSLWLAVVGLAAGLAGALAAGRLLSSLLYGVTPADPVTLALVPITLLALVVAASAAPARRAARIRPLDALKN